MYQTRRVNRITAPVTIVADRGVSADIVSRHRGLSAGASSTGSAYGAPTQTSVLVPESMSRYGAHESSWAPWLGPSSKTKSESPATGAVYQEVSVCRDRLA